MTMTRNATTERLEGRMLMSFSTADTFQISPGHAAIAQAMAADEAGDVFAVGYANNAANVQVGVVREKLAGSAAWTTVNVFSYAAGKPTTFRGVAVAPDGSLYISGGGTDGGGRGHWITLKSSNGSLSTIDDFVTSGQSEAAKVAVDASGDVFVAGQASYVRGNNITYNWVVRRRLAGQPSFTTADSFTNPGSGASASSVTTIAAGRAAGVYVVGSGTAANGSGNWVVRKSADAGATWVTVDTFQLTANAGSNQPFAVTGDGTGNLFVAGACTDAASLLVMHWVTRNTGDGGATWQTSDNYRLDPAKNAGAVGAGVDAAGSVYVAGWGIDGTNVRHAILRTNAGGAWTTVDDFQSGTRAAYAAFTPDAAGNLYAAGNTGAGEWFVRSSPAAGAAPAAPTSVFSTTTVSATGRKRHMPAGIDGVLN
jgi:hypothetical protein